MNNFLQVINPEEEIQKIVKFIQTTLREQNVKHVVLGVSGGVDSATSLFLLKKALPKEHIYLLHLPYFAEDKDAVTLLNTKDIPEQNKQVLSVKAPVDAFTKSVGITQSDSIRLANVMARMRMVTLFDLAKKVGGLVVGTENKSEHLLGYYTRFGDEASDIEPLRHLYKTHVYKVAEALGVPKSILSKSPTAGLWQDQTDEKEFGFSYKEADIVLYMYFEQKKSLKEIEEKGLSHAEQIIEYARKNAFKHNTPYIL